MAKRNIGGVLAAILLIPLSLVLIVVLQGGFVFVVFGLMPSLVAYFVDGHTGKPTFKTVLAFNLAGILPTMNDVVQSDSMGATMQVLMGDAYSWFLVYGAAACGYGILLCSRSLTQIGIIITDQTRTDMLTKKQAALVEEWGQRVKMVQG